MLMSRMKRTSDFRILNKTLRTSHTNINFQSITRQRRELLVHRFKLSKRLQNSSVRQKAQIDKYILDLHEHVLKFQRPREEINDIRTAVDKVIKSVTRLTGTKFPQFAFSKHILVGSMQEGTKILEPDEFDYLLILDRLSQPGILEVVPVEKDGRKYAHVRLRHMNDIKDYEEFSKAGWLISPLLSEANPTMPKATKHTANVNVREAIARSIQQFEENNLIIQMSTGVLQFSSSALHNIFSSAHGFHHCKGPSIKIGLRWLPYDTQSPTLDITVDITPAIEVRGGTSDIVSRDEVMLEDYYHQLLQQDRYMLVYERKWLDDRYGFKFSFPYCHMHMFDNISVNHKICFMLLKYMLHLKWDITPVLSSYQIKTVLELHADKCSYENSLLDCIVWILTACHIEKANTMQTIILKNNISERVLPHVLLEEIVNIFKCINCITGQETYDFIKCLDTVKRYRNMAINRRHCGFISIRWH